MTWFEALFCPRSLAIVGSVAEGKIGRVLLDQVLSGGFADVVVVNPKAEGTDAAPAVRSLAQRPTDGPPPDLVVVASPAATVAGALEDAGRAGARVAVILSAGFSESGNSAEEQALLRVARRFGLRLVGPNCAGIVNTKHRLFPTLETRPPAGEVAFVSQSGALGGAVLSWAEEQGVGLSKFVSYGNGVDLTEADFLDALREDGETRVVALYVETVSDGRRFLDVASRLAAAKPLVVIKSGRSEPGRRAALSHTGSIAGADAVFDAALRQCGAIRVEGIEEMFDLCRAFTMLPPLAGRRLAIVTNSGGPGVLAADRAAACRLDVPPPSAPLRQRLAERLPPFCALNNPFDLTVQGTGAAFRDVLIDVLTEYNVALAIHVNTPYLDAAPPAQAVVDAARATGKPIAASFLAGRPARAALPILRQGGVPNFATGERAVHVLALMGERYNARERRSRPPGRPADGPSSPQPLPWDGAPLEPEVMDWLDELGLPVIERRWARTADEAADAARAFDAPVAMKVVSPEILHKTDVGGVLLDVDGADAAAAAFERLRIVTAGRSFRGALVAPMAHGAIEVLVGVLRDAQFGPVIACGLGGIYTEALADIALRVAPIDPVQAQGMLSELRSAAILQGMRAQRAQDVDALVKLVASVSSLPLRFPQIGELDLNPVFLTDRGVRIGDARLIPAPIPDNA